MCSAVSRRASPPSRCAGRPRCRDPRTRCTSSDRREAPNPAPWGWAEREQAAGRVGHGAGELVDVVLLVRRGRRTDGGQFPLQVERMTVSVWLSRVHSTVSPLRMSVHVGENVPSALTVTWWTPGRIAVAACPAVRAFGPTAVAACPLVRALGPAAVATWPSREARQ